MNWMANSTLYSVSYAYDNVGNLLTETRSNGTTSSYTFDKNNRYKTIRHNKSVSAIASMDYNRDDTGKIISETSTFPAPDPTLSDSSENGSYNDVNQIVTWGGSGFVYDADGNLTAGANFSATYDNRNYPVSITQGATTTYSYDSFGNRVRSVKSSQTRNYHYDPVGRLLYETDAGNSVTVRYFYRGRTLVAMQAANGSVYFYHFDKTGNTVALTDITGAVANAYTYDPYGKILSSNGTLANSFTYVGAYGVMDEGNSIYYMKNRYYDSTTGRFFQKDPIGFVGGQTNLYAYVGGNPVDRIDYDGLGEDFYEVPSEESLRSLQLSSRNIGDIAAVGNLTLGFATVYTTIGAIALAPELTALGTLWAGVKVAVGLARLTSVLDRKSEYGTNGYNGGDAALDLLDPTRVIRKSYEHARKSDVESARESNRAIYETKCR